MKTLKQVMSSSLHFDFLHPGVYQFIGTTIYCWGVTQRLSSIPPPQGGGVAILLGASCYSNWLRRWPFWPHGLARLLAYSYR